MSFLKKFVSRTWNLSTLKISKTTMQASHITPPSPRDPQLTPPFNEPKPQPFYKFESNEWVSYDADPSNNATAHSKLRYVSSCRLLTWNIDVLVGFGEERMAAALNYLGQKVDGIPSNLPIIMFLQEMGLSDLRQIQNTSWIQSRFYITDLNAEYWKSDFYGTTTLIDKRLSIQNVFRTPFPSQYQRDGFFVDVQLRDTDKVLRLCNVHLESLVADPPIRPQQMEQAAKYMHDNIVHAALLAGDCNAIQPFDRTLHSSNDLKDAYLELGGEEDDDEGCTWGQQVPEPLRKQFGLSRMDKVLFCGDADVKSLERIGVGVKVEDMDTRRKMVDAGMTEFVTDHYGLMAEIELGNTGLVVSSDD
jgi:tyrosyl-DNA phosphodiesterase 2